MIEPREPRRFLVAGLAVAGQGDQQGARRVLQGDDATRQFVAIEMGHPDVEDEDVRPQRRRTRQRLTGIDFDIHGMPLRFEKQAERLCGVLVVIDHHDPQAKGLTGDHRKRFCGLLRR